MWLFVLIFLQSAHSAQSVKSCSRILTEGYYRQELESLISYFEDLFNQRTLVESDLQRMRAALLTNQLLNPISIEQSLKSSAALIHFHAIEEKIATAQFNEFDLRILEKWAGNFLSHGQKKELARENTSLETKNVYQKIIFQPLGFGEFQYAADSKIRKIDIPIEMSSDLITQWQWSYIMKANLPLKDHSAEVVLVPISGAAIPMQPDIRVGNVSYQNIRFMVQRLNQLSETNDLQIYELIPDHHPEYFYSLAAPLELIYAGAESRKSRNGEEILKVRKNKEDKIPELVNGKIFYDLTTIIHWSGELFLTPARFLQVGYCKMGSPKMEIDCLGTHIPFNFGIRLVRIKKEFKAKWEDRNDRFYEKIFGERLVKIVR